jgi:Protein of unknown function (DUF3558)
MSCVRIFVKRLLTMTPLLAALVVGATACDSATGGRTQLQSVASSAGVDTGAPSEQSSSSASRSREHSAGSGKLANIDACKLVTQQEGRKYRITGVERSNLDGARGCSYRRADSDYSVGVTIREEVGLDVYNRDYGPTTDTTVAGYPAIQQKLPSGGCALSVGFTKSSRIDVDVEASTELGNDKWCKLSGEFAQIVASKVTPG